MDSAKKDAVTGGVVGYSICIGEIGGCFGLAINNS
jgi:hypothetical protein